MSVSAAAIVTWLLSHPGWTDRNIPAEQRAPMLQRYAAAIAAEDLDAKEAATVLAQGYEDTKFAFLVLADRCDEMPKGQRCDNGRARGPFGLHRSACRSAYEFPAGSDESITWEVRCTIGLLYFHSRRCKEHAITPMLAMFGGMGGNGCHAIGAARKVALARKIAIELAQLDASEKRTRVARKEGE